MKKYIIRYFYELYCSRKWVRDFIKKHNITFLQNIIEKRKQRLNKWYLNANHKKLKNVFYMECYECNQITDSQLQMAKEISKNKEFSNWKVVWGINDKKLVKQIPFNQNYVYYLSKNWVKTQITSAIICVNHESQFYKNPQKNQVISYTPHGHHFKRSPIEQLKKYNHNVENWKKVAKNLHYYISFGKFHTTLQEKNVDLNQHYIELGEPRNDSLINNSINRNEIRKQFNINKRQKVILYAPTYRGYKKETMIGIRSDEINLLNVNKLSKKLGNNYVIFVRAHQVSYISHQKNKNIIDVSNYPQINDLILASDIGLFDYSSIRFDYALTYKPQVYFTNDKEKYFKHSPPMFDYSKSIIGQETGNIDDLVNAIKTAPSWAKEHKRDYVRFINKFNEHADGNASYRVVKELINIYKIKND